MYVLTTSVAAISCPQLEQVILVVRFSLSVESCDADGGGFCRMW